MVDEVTGSSVSTKPKPFVFVLMPFEPAFNDIYKFGIKGAADEVGAYAERVDEQIFTEGILDRIFNQISKADVIVADMTGRNPNVFYEVGYAHALGEIVLLLTQHTEDIPFDLKHRQHVAYEGKIELLKRELTPRLKWAIEEAARGGSGRQAEQFTLRIQGVEATRSDTGDPPILKGSIMSRSFHATVELRNDSAEKSQDITHVYMFCAPNARIFPSYETTGIYLMTTEGISEAPDALSPFAASPLDSTDGLTMQYRLQMRFLPLPSGAVELARLNLGLKADADDCDEPIRLRLYGSSGYHDFRIRLQFDLVKEPPKKEP